LRLHELATGNRQLATAVAVSPVISPLRTVRVGVGPVAVVDDAATGHIFVAAAGAHQVDMLDARSGASLHATTVHGSPILLAADGVSGHVFALLSSGVPDQVSMLDARTGRLLRTVPVGQRPFGIALDAPDGRAFVTGFDDAVLSVLDTHSGAVLRTVPLYQAHATVVAADGRAGRVYVATNAGLDVLDARSGTVVATAPVSPGALAVDEEGGRVYSAVGSGVVVLDARRGTPLGEVAVPGAPSALALDAGASRLVAGGTDAVSVLDTHNNAVLRGIHGGGETIALAVDHLTGQALVVTAGPLDAPGSDQGLSSGNKWGSGYTVCELSLAHGRARAVWGRGRLARPGVGLGTGETPAPPDRQFTEAGSGYVSVLDLATGTPRASLPVGRTPAAIAVDERTGHVFVANLDDDTVSVLALHP